MIIFMTKPLLAQNAPQETPATPATPTTVYESLLNRKETLRTEYEGKKQKLKIEHQRVIAQKRSRQEAIEAEISSLKQEMKKIEDTIQTRHLLQGVLMLDGGLYSYPIFMLMLFLVFIYLRINQIEFLNMYKKQIIVLIAVIFSLYSLGAMAKPMSPSESRENIEKQLTLFNRLQDATELDKTIIKIEQHPPGMINIPAYDVSDAHLYTKSYFKKGSFDEYFTLAALYAESNQKTKTFAMLHLAIGSLKGLYKITVINELDAIWSYLQREPNVELLIEMSQLIIKNQKNIKRILSALEYIKVQRPQDAELLLTDALKQMKETPDLLEASIYLHKHARATDGDLMYKKALMNARTSKDFIELSRYAFKNGLTANAQEALQKAFKSSKNTLNFIEYAQFAFEHHKESAEEAYKKALSMSKSPDDYLSFAYYALSLSRSEDALSALRGSLTKSTKIEDLLKVIDLALKTKQSDIYKDGMVKSFQKAKKFEEFMNIAQFAHQKNDYISYFQAVEALINSAVNYKQFIAMFTYVLQVRDYLSRGSQEGVQSESNALEYYDTLIKRMIEKSAQTRMDVSVYRSLRSMLIQSKINKSFTPLHMAMTQYTGSEQGLYMLVNEFTELGAKGDANIPLIKILKQSKTRKSIDKLLLYSIENEYWDCARESALKLVNMGLSTHKIPDPNILNISKFKPNGNEINILTLYAILAQKTNHYDDARVALETSVSSFISEYTQRPDALLKGEINTYFYLRQLWEVVGEGELLNQYHLIYKMIEDQYIKSIDETAQDELQQLEDALKIQIQSFDIEYQNLESSKARTLENLEQIKQKSLESQMKGLAVLSRSVVYIILSLFLISISIFSAWIYQGALTHFKIFGFVFKFFETFGFLLCFYLFSAPVGVALILISQIGLLMIHIQQENEGIRGAVIYRRLHTLIAEDRLLRHLKWRYKNRLIEAELPGPPSDMTKRSDI